MEGKKGHSVNQVLKYPDPSKPRQDQTDWRQLWTEKIVLTTCYFGRLHQTAPPRLWVFPRIFLQLI
jgi:hypothetical protein